MKIARTIFLLVGMLNGVMAFALPCERHTTKPTDAIYFNSS